MVKKNGQEQIVHYMFAQSMYTKFNHLLTLFFKIKRNIAWVTNEVSGANNAHPWAECSNRGVCDRKRG